MEKASLLRPMPPDALTRRPAQQAAVPVRPITFLPPQRDPETLHAPAFAPRPPKKPEPEAELDALLASFMDDDDDEPLEDAVPTASMPMPVCVPLYEAAPEKKRRGRWLLLGVVLALGAAVWLLWKKGYLSLDSLQNFNIRQFFIDLAQ